MRQKRVKAFNLVGCVSWDLRVNLSPDPAVISAEEKWDQRDLPARYHYRSPPDRGVDGWIEEVDRSQKLNSSSSCRFVSFWKWENNLFVQSPADLKGSATLLPRNCCPMNALCTTLISRNQQRRRLLFVFPTQSFSRQMCPIQVMLLHDCSISMTRSESAIYW